ncbi:hypothetical protein [Nocardiopsis sp. NRRL B-16309]|uniref:hypothetical protein n=1 Tax=Nocardiopsis sp. NRRL B-16309 TaxID=1519494 RepID=UPI0006AFF61E|nr:hypothetical protein [Nocardiopsis sp. NRRL B-16309]KOX16317.1 hypothetical protein ADL05_12645 [Nocardiopsis sp. NRRL B-16309]
MATPSPAPLPPTLAQSLALLWGEVPRRPGTLFAVTTVPILLGWLAVAAVRAALLSSGRWENGTITFGSWLDLVPGQGFLAVLAFSGMPVAYALAAVLVIPHRVGPRTRPVALRAALAVVGGRWPLLVGWWFLIGFFAVLFISGYSLFWTEQVWTGVSDEEEFLDLLLAVAGLLVLPVALALGFPLIPVALIEARPLANREATYRARELSSGRRFAEFGCFLLAVGLLVFPSAVAARVADLPADTVDGIALGMVTQGLLLGLVAPFAVVTLLAPLLLPGGDALRVSGDLRKARPGESRHVATGAFAAVVLVASPLAGGYLTWTVLTGVPVVSTLPTRELPGRIEPLSDGSGYAGIGSDGDGGSGHTDTGTDPLVLSA